MGRSAASHRTVQIYNVERVGRLGAELQFEPFGEIEVAEDAKIDILQSGGVNDVPPGGPFRPYRHLGKSCGIEPAVDNLVARAIRIEYRVADQIGAIVVDAVEIGVGPVRDRQWPAAPHRDDGRERPPVQNRARDTVPFFDVIDAPDAREHEIVPPVEVGAPAITRDVVHVLHVANRVALRSGGVKRFAESVEGSEGEVAREALLRRELQAVIGVVENRFGVSDRRELARQNRTPRINVVCRRARRGGSDS